MATTSGTQKHRRGHAGELAPLALPDDDQELLAAVVTHYVERLWEHPEAEGLLRQIGAGVEVAKELSIGLCDRTLGLRLPDRQWRAGRQVRDRLSALGVLRPSGHEDMRGCLVVPVVSDGAVVALYGHSLKDGAGRFVTALPGGIFTRSGGAGALLVTGSIPEALAVLGSGGSDVVAPGRPRGYSTADLEHLGRHDELVVSGTLPAELRATLAGAGTRVSGLAPGTDLRVVLSSATEPADALRALLEEARREELPGGAPPDAESPERGNLHSSHVDATHVDAASGDAMQLALGTPPVRAPGLRLDTAEGPDVSYLHLGGRSWRVRGAQAAAAGTGLALRVALSVTDYASGRTSTCSTSTAPGCAPGSSRPPPPSCAPRPGTSCSSWPR